MVVAHTDSYVRITQAFVTLSLPLPGRVVRGEVPFLIMGPGLKGGVCSMVREQCLLSVTQRFLFPSNSGGWGTSAFLRSPSEFLLVNTHQLWIESSLGFSGCWNHSSTLGK